MSGNNSYCLSGFYLGVLNRLITFPIDAVRDGDGNLITTPGLFAFKSDDSGTLVVADPTALNALGNSQYQIEVCVIDRGGVTATAIITLNIGAVADDGGGDGGDGGGGGGGAGDGGTGSGGGGAGGDSGDDAGDQDLGIGVGGNGFGGYSGGFSSRGSGHSLSDALSTNSHSSFGYGGYAYSGGFGFASFAQGFRNNLSGGLGSFTSFNFGTTSLSKSFGNSEGLGKVLQSQLDQGDDDLSAVDVRIREFVDANIA